MTPTRGLPILALLLATGLAEPARAQTTLLRMDNGAFDQAWSLTSPNAGPGDWIGVAYQPPLEHPFRVVSATMYYIDNFCCTNGVCGSCGVFNDWNRRVITGANLTLDSAGLTPDLAAPLVNQAPVGASPPAFTGAGTNFTSPPWTLTPDVWSLPAGTVFDRAGRLFYAIQYANGDPYMNFIVQSGTQHATHRAIFTNDSFASRAAIWTFGNVGMQVTVEPVFFLKPTASAPAARTVLAGQTGVTVLTMRVRGGNSATTVSTVQVDGSGSGNEATGVSQVRLVVDQNQNGVADAGEPTVATGTFPADNGRVTLSPNRTLAVGATEEWLVVYDLSAQPVGGHTFTAALTSSARVSSNLGAPFVSGTAGGTGALTGAPITVAGRLSVAAGPANPPPRVVPSGAAGLSVLQLRLTSENEDFSLTGLAFEAAGSVNDLTEVTGVRLYRDTNGDGLVSGGEPQLAAGTFPGDDGRLALTFAAFSIPANTSRDLLLVVDLAAAASGGDTFRALLATASDVTATGVASGPLPTTGPRAFTGTPVIGETITVGGALTAQVGPASPASGTAQPGTADIELLQVNLTAQGEDVRLGTLTFRSAGTGHEALDVARARLLRDVNGNGAVDGADVLVGQPQTFSADDGVLTFAPAAEVVPAGAMRSYLLAYDFTGAPTGGETFTARLASAADLTATGQASGAAVNAVGAFPLVGGTITLLGGLSVTAGPQNPAALRVQPGALDVPVLQLQAAAQGETFTVSRLVLTAAGSLVDDQAVVQVRLHHDLGVPGVRDMADVPLASGTFSQDDGQLVFTFSPPLALAPGTSQRWLVTYDLGLGATPGQTFRAFVAGPQEVTAAGTLSGPAAVSGLPVTGPTQSVGGGLTLTAGPANPAGGQLDPAGSSQPMLQLRLTTDLEAISVTGLTITGSGSGNEATAVSAVNLYVDADADGVVDPVGDIFLAGPLPFAMNDGAAVFTFPARTLPGAASEVWLVAYDLGGAAQAGDTFQAAVTQATHVTAVAPSGPLPRASGAPVSGGAKTVLGRLVVSRGPATPAAATVRRDAVAAPVLQVRLRGAGEAFTVRDLAFTAVGSLDEVGHLVGASLVLDADGSGTLTPGDTQLAGPVPFLGDDGQVVFTGLTLPVPANGAVDALVTVDLSGAAPGGATLRLSLRDPSDVTATGYQGRAVSPAGLPVSSDTLTTGGVLEVGLGAASPLGRVARRGDTQVPAMQLRLLASTEPVTLSQVTLHASGSGHDAQGLAQVAIWLDADADGLVSPGEPSLAQGAFAADDGALTLALSQTVQVGPALHLLVTFTLSNTPVGAETFRVSLDPHADLVHGSASGAVAVSGVPVSGGVVTVGGGFSVALGPQSSPGGVVNQALQGVPVLQLALGAVNERCTVEQVTLRGTGSMHDRDDLTQARLLVDVDNSGTVTPADLPVGQPATYPDDDAELVFTGLNRSLAPNTTERWLLAYDLSGSASNLETFAVRLEGPARLQVRCQVSGPVVPAGQPLTSGTFTIQEDGALVVRRGQHTPPARFVPAGTVRTPALQLRAAASVQPLTLDALTLTASVAQGPASAVVGRVELFLDVNQDGQLDRADTLLASGGAPDAQGKVAFTGLGLALPLDEAQFLLAVVDLAAGAAPGARLSLGLARDADAVAQSAFGGALTTGAPIYGLPLTVAGALNVRAGRPAVDVTVQNDDAGLVGLDLVLEATWEAFRVERLTVTAEGTMDPAAAVRGLSVVVDEDDDGVADPGEPVAAQGVTFPEGAVRAPLEGLDVRLPAGERRRLLVVLDLDGVATVDETLRLALASDLDLGADGDRRGLTHPVGAPVAGDTFTVGASLQVAAGPVPPTDDVVPADATGVPVMQLAVRAANEDVTLARLALSVSGSLDDARAVSGLHLFLDADGDGALDPEDVEVAAPARPAGDDGMVSFGPLSERVSKNGTQVYLVTLDLSGSGQAGQDLAVRLASDGDVTAFGARSGAVAARGAPVAGARVTLVGALNVRLGGASPAGQGVRPGATFAALQLELFTRGEAVTVDRLTVTLNGSADDAQVVQEVAVVRDADGDGVVGEGETPLSWATGVSDDGRVVLDALGLTVPANDQVRLLVTVRLTENAAPGGTLRVAVAAPEDVAARGAHSATLTVAGPPVLGSAFTVTRPPEPEGPGVEAGGCGCAAHEDPDPGPGWAAWGVAVALLGLRRRRT